MAIKQDITDERFGYTIPGAYIRLAYVRWSTADMKAVATFSVWATPTAEAEGKECIDNIDVDVTHLADTLQASMYEEIKKLADYALAEDV